MHYYLDVLKKYCVFSGRAGRSEFWFFALFNFIICLILFGLMYVNKDNTGWAILFTIIYYMYALAVLLPSIGVAVRRLHDIGKGGGWYFISFVPVIGWLWALYLYTKGSELDENRFGPIPQNQTEN